MAKLDDERHGQDAPGPPPAPTVLDYAGAEEEPEIPYAQPMMDWRRRAGYAFILVAGVGVAGFAPMAVVVFMATMLPAIVLTLYYMTRAGLEVFGVGYAVNQLVLAVCLMPFFFLSLVIMPVFVESDLMRWRDPPVR